MGLGDIHHVPDSPNKRSKGDDGHWRHPGLFPANTSATFPVNGTATRDGIVVENDQSQCTNSDTRRGTPTRTPTGFEHKHTDTADSFGHARESASVSSAHGCRQVRARSENPASTRTQKVSGIDNSQTIDREDAAVHGARNVRHTVPHATHSTGDSARPPTLVSSEPSVITQPVSTVVAWPGKRLQDEPEALVERLSVEASFMEKVRKDNDRTEQASRSDFEVQLLQLASGLRETRVQRDCLEREIAATREACPDMRVMEENARQADEEVREAAHTLEEIRQAMTKATHMLEEKRRAAASARRSLEATINQTNTTKTAEQKLQKVTSSQKSLRFQLNNLVD